MLKNLLFSGVATSVLLMSATTASAIIYDDDMSQARSMTPAGSSFEGELAREYKALFIFEADEMYDWPDADFFAEKALAANKGMRVLPEQANDWNIDSVHLGELNAARDKLVTALDNGGRDAAPREAAVAQARYDCWVEQQEEGHQPAHIAACRGEFNAALASLETAMQPKVVDVEKKETPAKIFVENDEVARTVVYFDWNKTDLKGDAQSKLDQFVDEMRQMKDIVLYVEGHADRSGPADYNLSLSKDRAERVRGELIKQGLNVGEIEDFKIEAEGEAAPAVATEDGVRKLENRRVEIVARGVTAKLAPASTKSSAAQN